MRVDASGRWQPETPEEFERIREIAREELRAMLPEIVQALRADLLLTFLRVQRRSL